MFRSCVDSNLEAFGALLQQENDTFGETKLRDAFPVEFNNSLFPFGIEASIPHLEKYTVYDFVRFLNYYRWSQDVMLHVGFFGIATSVVACLIQVVHYLKRVLKKTGTSVSASQEHTRRRSTKVQMSSKRKSSATVQDELLLLSLVANISNCAWWAGIGFVCRDSINVASLAYPLCLATSYHVAVLWLRVMFASAKHNLETQGTEIGGFKLKDISHSMLRNITISGYFTFIGPTIVRLVSFVSSNMWWGYFTRVIESCVLFSILTVVLMSMAYMAFGRSALQSLKENRKLLEEVSQVTEHLVAIRALEKQVRGVMAFHLLACIVPVQVLLIIQMSWEVVRDQFDFRLYIFTYFSALLYLQAIGTTLSELAKMRTRHNNNVAVSQNTASAMTTNMSLHRSSATMSSSAINSRVMTPNAMTSLRLA